MRIFQSLDPYLRILSIKSNFYISKCKTHSNIKTFKEIRIPVQWGFIAGKLWGSDQNQPILAVHGWQDNAGTWDTLMPYLIDEQRSILAIDFPGHGYSSWFPPGMNYHTWDFPRTILYIQKYYNWDKVSLLCHSMGSIAGFRFSSLLNDQVNFYIAIDSLAIGYWEPNKVLQFYRTAIQKSHISQQRINTEPPTYTYDKIRERWYLSVKKSVDWETLPYLLERGIMKSQTSKKYYISRDSRIKHIMYSADDKVLFTTMAKNLKCPTLYIKAKDSHISTDEFSIEIRETVAEHNPQYEFHTVEGTHHVHLNNPDLVAPIIKQFLLKYET